MPNDNDDIVSAIRELTRVMVVLHGDFSSRADAIRKLDESGIKPSSIAAVFGIPTKDVTSVLSKAKKRSKRSKG